MVSFVPPKAGLRMFPNPVVLKALTTSAPFANLATVSPPEVVVPIASSNPGAIGLVQSITILPDRSFELSTDCTASHGTARATTSLCAIAFATEANLRRLDDSSLHDREPYTTWWPFAVHSSPNAVPTLPLPMTAIFMVPSDNFVMMYNLAVGCGGSAGDSSPGQFAVSALGQQMARDLDVQINGVEQLLLLDVFALSVRHMNRSRTDQQRSSPVGESGNVGGEGGNHGFNPGHSREFHVRDFKFEFSFGLARHGLCDLPA